MAFLQIRNLHKRFDRTLAVDGLDLDVHEGEFFTLLGPSGCGKTTTLRVVGGLEKPDQGEIHVGDRCIVALGQNIFVKPEKRDMGMVFQSYALWPHMTVDENIAYPLKLRRMKGPAVRQKVHEMLDLVGLAGLGERPIPALSGGQQQRVALARALVFSPRILLLDEPLSNLDAQLREQMRRELKSLQRRVNVTVLFVTHDQIEGLSLSDRIGIMSQGRLEQVGQPEEVYHRPATSFARDFLGKIFALSGKVVNATEDRTEIEPTGIPHARLEINSGGGQLRREGVLEIGREVVTAIRPEQIAVWTSRPEKRSNVLQASVEGVHFLGDRYEYTVSLGSETRVLVLPSSQVLRSGQQVFVELKSDALTVWPRPG